MKGISPMIAVVLLIAFTVAVGGILSVWFSSFTRTSTAQVENASIDVTKCASTYIDVTSVTSAGIIITNRGTQNINDVSCFANNGTNISTVAIATLGSGASNAGAWIRGTNTRIDCSGKCLGVGVTGKCTNADSCWV